MSAEPVTPTSEEAVKDPIRVAALRLSEAARTRTPCAPVRGILPDTSLETAYAVQDLLTEEALDHGARIVGRKIGLTSPAVQQQLGVDQPDFGFLFASMRCSEDEPIDIGRLLQPRIEAEIAFRLGADLDLAEPTLAQVRAAVATMSPALEIVDSRIAGWDITFADTVADNASSGLFVIGAQAVPLSDVDLRPLEMRLTDGAGSVVSRGRGADCLGDPVAALAWLARAAHAVRSPLMAGDIVLSGALGPMVPVSPGGRYTAEIGGLGTVQAAFTRT